MIIGKSKRKLATVLACAILIGLAQVRELVALSLDGVTPAEVMISNRAEASYQDEAGTTFKTVSEIVTVTVLSVPALIVTPDETSPSATAIPHERITRSFRVCNTGNVADSYEITRAEVNTPATLVDLHFDNNNDGVVNFADTTIVLSNTRSQTIAPGACIPVLAVVDTNDSHAGDQLRIGLTARSSVTDPSGRKPEDVGLIINAVGAGPRLNSPDNPSLPPVKSVNGASQAIVSAGIPFTYTIVFRNHGDTSALNVLVADDLPTQINYVPGTLRVNDQGVTDAQDGDNGYVQNRRVAVQLAEVVSQQLVTITFQAQLNNTATNGVGITNVAIVSAQNVAAISSTSAVVVIDPFGTVFAGRGGSGSPISGASVAMCLDQDCSNPLIVPPGLGFSPNVPNDNPYSTDGNGHFSFALRPDQVGSENSPVRYFIRVTAPGYATRMIEARIQPANGLFQLLVHSLDSQLLARAGGFELVQGDVTNDNMAAVALNIPMFESRGLEISKSVDRPRVEIGDAVTYRVEIHNPTMVRLSDVTVHDRLPNSFQYVPGSGRLSLGSATDSAKEPDTVNDELVFRLGELPGGATARLVYRVRVGAGARPGEQDNVASALGVFPNGEAIKTAPAVATVLVSSGVFSTQQLIVGRVFFDANRNGKFDDGDEPLEGVRLYLQSGKSVTTDSRGLYNFPSVSEGAQVVSLDPITLPQQYSLSDGGTVAGRSWVRLLTSPLGGGSLLRQNFALLDNEVARNKGTSLVAAVQPNSRYAPLGSDATSPVDVPAGGTLATGATLDEVRYRVQVATDAQFNAIVYDGLSAKPECPTDNLEPGKYFWRFAAGKKSKEFSKPAPIEVKSIVREEVASTEALTPVAPGDVKILTPTPNEVVLTPAMRLDASVALNWKVKVQLNGSTVSEDRIGTSRQDQKNNISTYSFVGLELKPGPNEVRVTAVSPTSGEGKSVTLDVMGRGPARRLEIVPEKGSIQADGRDSARLLVRAFDQWGNPAADEQVALETSSGQLIKVDSSQKQLNNGPAGAAALPDEKLTDTQSRVIVMLSGGQASVKLLATGTPGEAKLHASMGQYEALGSVRVIPETRAPILVGLGQLAFGQSLPDRNLQGDQGNTQRRFSFFYSGRIFEDTLLTLTYDSQRPINRTAGRDRLFQLDPLDRVYPVLGDSSTRFESAQSNSKLYARVDHNRSYAMFGDFESDLEDLSLAGYSRKLTGVKVHVENNQGDFASVTGAKPDTAFARDVFPAGNLSLIKLSNAEILPGSESVVLEVRDRRNPEIIISREILVRSVDYNLDSLSGELLLLRYISAFDFNLNLTQIVVTYEHRANSLSAGAYTARARKNFRSLGLQLGFAGVLQRQQDEGSFLLAGFDGEKALPKKGVLKFAFARSQGQVFGNGNSFESVDAEHNGNAYLVELDQPLSFYFGVIKARYSYSSAGFLNPFGATVTAGSRRGEVAFELKPRPNSLLHFGLIDERNQTENVSNKRLTLSAEWEQRIGERTRLHFGYDHRSYSDASENAASNSVDSNLITVGADIKLTDKLQLAAKREQNLGDADPTYPDQTTVAATYQVNKWAKFFLTQRFAAAAITPIGDFSTSAGFASTGARRETAFGVETRVGKFSSMTGRYQLENGISGTDSFAVIGLQNRLPLTHTLSIDLGFERGFHMAGDGESFNSITTGLGWQPTEDFRSSVRYEFRDRTGNGQLLAIGAAGRIRDGVTALVRLQMAKTGFNDRQASSTDGMAAFAVRPLDSDRFGLLFSFTHRSLFQDGGTTPVPTRDRLDSLSSDAYYQATSRLELYARFALRFSATGQSDVPFVSTSTYLTQERLQYRLTRHFDWAAEARYLFQPASRTQRSSYGSELGYWLLPDLRLGVGYNFNSVTGLMSDVNALPNKRGFYFTITSKLSNLFDLFGTSNNDLAGSAPDKPKNEEAAVAKP
ncbi:MAG TPA: isopeptide-forming domain-containing fimbrial protein [Pyrinomonadaceae bacterium]